MENSSETYDLLRTIIRDNLKTYEDFDDIASEAAVEVDEQFVLIDRNHLPEVKVTGQVAFVGGQAFSFLSKDSTYDILYKRALDILAGAEFFQAREKLQEEERKKLNKRRLEIYRSVVDKEATEVPEKLHALLDEVYKARYGS